MIAKFDDSKLLKDLENYVNKKGRTSHEEAAEELMITRSFVKHLASKLELEKKIRVEYVVGKGTILLSKKQLTKEIKQIPIISVETTLQGKSGPKIRTGVDRLLAYVLEVGTDSCTRISKKLNIPLPKIEEWAMILEEHRLIEIDYSPHRGMIIKARKQPEKNIKTKVERIKKGKKPSIFSRMSAKFKRKKRKKLEQKQQKKEPIKEIKKVTKPGTVKKKPVKIKKKRSRWSKK